MTDEIAVQGQRPSPLPYALGGAAIGGAAGYFGANYLPAKKPMYESYQDIIKEVQDTTDFSKLTEGKSDAVKDALNEAKTQSEGFAKLEKLSFEELTSAKVDVLDAENAVRKEYETAVKALKEKAPDDELIEKVAKELNKDAKDITEDMKTQAKNAINADRKKYFEKEYKAVEEALDKVVKEAGDKKVLDGAAETKYNALKEWGTKAEEALKPLLEKCKTGNKLLWAGVGAAVLAIAGLLIAPKSKKD